MLRALFVAIVTLAGAGPVLAAADIDICRDPAAEAEARLVACSAVTADDTINGKPRAAAYQVIGDSFMKKRDYDSAIAAFGKAHDADPESVGYVNSRGIAYSSKGDDEHALADYDLCLQMRPNFANAYNNRGIIFLRKLDFPRALDEFNAAIKFGPTSPNRYIHLNNRARAETLLQQYDAALADYSEAQKLNADGSSVPSNRCMTYTEMKRFDEAIADCNEALAKTPKNVFVLTSRAKCLSRQGRSRCGAGRLQRGDQDRPELHPRACRTRAVF
ncbi:tetratricopeptide repeat protein [Afipia sp. GAS231]|uniref:tetratricopeptide repeat protein n=1 Tax=Afipia sp. GAS231 TaxID=1882747 RepID=UPI000879F20E|nr:Tetratricopeptide repeat-containing protein [Afipia sp. GAS231]